MKTLEDKFLKDDRVTGVSSFIGQGPPRFYLPVDPEDPYSSYGQFIVNTDNFKDVQTLIDELQPWADANVPPSPSHHPEIWSRPLRIMAGRSAFQRPRHRRS